MEFLTLEFLLNKAWILGLGIYWYHKRESARVKREHDASDVIRDDKIRDLVTRAEMKEHIAESMAPYKEDQGEIKLLLRSLNENVVRLSQAVAVQEALNKRAQD